MVGEYRFAHDTSGFPAWQGGLIFAEGFTNVVRHAHQNLPPTTLIDLEVKLFDDYLEIRIWDRGQPFKLEAILHSIDATAAQSRE